MSIKLPKPQIDHLLRIASSHQKLTEAGEPELPAGWCNSRPEQALVKKGLVRHWEEVRPLGGGGAIGLFKVTWKFCDLTDEGWQVCNRILSEPE